MKKLGDCVAWFLFFVGWISFFIYHCVSYEMGINLASYNVDWVNNKWVLHIGFIVLFIVYAYIFAFYLRIFIKAKTVTKVRYKILLYCMGWSLIYGILVHAVSYMAYYYGEPWIS